MEAPRHTALRRAHFALAAMAMAAVASGCFRSPSEAGVPQAAPIAWGPRPQPTWNDATPLVTTASGDPAAIAPAPTVAPPPEPVAPPPPPPSYPFHRALEKDLEADAPARRHADLSVAACKKELAARALPVARSKSPAKGVASPMRITGPIRGVTFRMAPAPSPYGIFDCRMALALDELAQVVAPFGVTEMRIDNTYRPRAHLPGRKKPSQHAHGLALDIVSMTLGDGRVLSAKDHWNAPIGAVVCGPDAQLDAPTEEAILLRTIVCEVAARGVFHHMLTPSYDAAHRDHFHFDIKRDASRRSVH